MEYSFVASNFRKLRVLDNLYIIIAIHVRTVYTSSPCQSVAEYKIFLNLTFWMLKLVLKTSYGGYGRIHPSSISVYTISPLAFYAAGFSFLCTHRERRSIFVSASIYSLCSAAIDWLFIRLSSSSVEKWHLFEAQPSFSRKRLLLTQTHKKRWIDGRYLQYLLGLRYKIKT